MSHLALRFLFKFFLFFIFLLLSYACTRNLSINPLNQQLAQTSKLMGKSEFNNTFYMWASILPQ
jgi:hypothetical protein